jgi:hypothetical protein
MNILLENESVSVATWHKGFDVGKCLGDVNSVTLVGVFTRLHNPNVILTVNWVTSLLFIILFKFLKLWVFWTLFDVKGDWKRFKRVFSHELVILLHIFK